MSKRATLDDIQHLAVERIFLLPDYSEGVLGYVWCDDPAPAPGLKASEAVAYIREDIHRALIEKQGKAAIRGMDAAKATATLHHEQAKRLHKSSNPDALESERDANASLTGQVLALEEERERLLSGLAYLKASI